MAVCMWISKAPPMSVSCLLLPNNNLNNMSRRPPAIRLRSPPPPSASLHIGVEAVKEANPADLSFQDAKERISKLFDKVELSVSAYDTAWVALVPSPNYHKAPYFPQCLKWLMENQLDDGSWGLPHHYPLLVKDALSSTLACILALKRWGVGEEHINKGLHFIELNSASATDVNQHSPIGFDIIFPGMLEYAKDLNLKLPLKTTDFDSMLRNKELELRRCQSQESEAYLAYVSEGFGNLHDWSKIMKYQMKNGSLFNSPATTAAAFTYNQNGACLNYLRSLLEKFGNAVPTVYPHDLHLRLSMIDNLERLGIDRHFSLEIQNVLDDTYRCWLQGDEQIFMDVATCAMAFRMLRTNGYDVSSDLLANISKGGCWNSLGENFGDVLAALEVYKSSEIIIYEDEISLREQNVTSRNFLRQKLSNSVLASKRFKSYIDLEVDNTLKYPFNADLQRMYNRRNIEHYNVYGTRVMKTSYCSVNISNNDFLKLAVEDFNSCQSIYRTELECLERWVVENRLDKLKFARQKAAYCYFSAAATLLSPELSDARNSWAKNGILTTVVDDFFDVGGSMEELVNLIELMEKWNVNVDTDCCSEQVRIIFLALQNAIHELEEKAFKWQARSVRSHIIETWLKLMNSTLREAEWARDSRVPTLDEYVENGYVSFALGPIILPALYFVGPKLSEEIVRSSEYAKLYELVSTVGRILNDVQSYKRERQEGKLNAVPLHMIHCNGCISEEDAVKQIKILISLRERELLRLILKESGSVVPRACKNLFWNMCKVLNLFYAADDGFTSNDISSTVKAIIHQPISISLDSVSIN